MKPKTQIIKTLQFETGIYVLDDIDDDDDKGMLSCVLWFVYLEKTHLVLFYYITVTINDTPLTHDKLYSNRDYGMISLSYRR